MIRVNSLITLAVVLGLAYVFGKEAETEKHQEGESLLSDIEPEAADAPEVEKKEGTVNDPRYRYRYRYRNRFRYRRSRYRRTTTYPPHTPYPTQEPTTLEPCSTSRPPAEEKWANNWQGHMFFECPRGSTIISIKSVFRDCQHDRIWEFGCGYNEASTSRGHCHWDHGYVNDPKKGIFFNCPNHGFIAGVSSDYFSGHGDRRFTFKCCNDKNFDHADCHHSRLLKGSFEYNVDRDKRFYITGINSYYIAGKRDRDWKIDYCRSEPVYFGSGEGYVSEPEDGADVIKN